LSTKRKEAACSTDETRTDNNELPVNQRVVVRNTREGVADSVCRRSGSEERYKNEIFLKL